MACLKCVLAISDLIWMKPYGKLVAAVSRILLSLEHSLSHTVKFSLTLSSRCFLLRLKRLADSFYVTVTNHHQDRVTIFVIHTVYSLRHKAIEILSWQTVFSLIVFNGSRMRTFQVSGHFTRNVSLANRISLRSNQKRSSPLQK